MVDDDILRMSAKELKEICRALQFTMYGKNSILITCIVFNLESISDLETDSFDHFNWILEDDA